MSNAHLSSSDSLGGVGVGGVGVDPTALTPGISKSSSSHDDSHINNTTTTNSSNRNRPPETASTSSDEEDTEEQLLVTTRLLAPHSEGSGRDVGSGKNKQSNSSTMDSVVMGTGGEAVDGIIDSSCASESSSICRPTPGGGKLVVLTDAETHPLTLTTATTALLEMPASPRPPTSLSRRRAASSSSVMSSSSSRRGGGGTTTAVLVPSLASSSSTTTTSSSSLRQRGATISNVANGSSNVSLEQQQVFGDEGRYNSSSSNNNNAGGLRASLDSGMAAVRRWIRHRSVVADAPPSTSATTSTASVTTPTWVTSSPASRFRQTTATTATEDANSSTPSEEDDLILLDAPDDNSYTRAGGSIHSSSTPVDDFDSFQQMLQQHSQQQAHHSQQQQQQRLPPPTILENSIDEMESYRSLRQRALSEPDALRIRDFLFQRALNAPQRGAFRRRRAHFPTSTTTSASARQHSRRTRQRTRSDSIELASATGGARTSSSSSAATSSQLSSSAAEVLFASARSLRQQQQQQQQQIQTPQQEVGGDRAIDIPTEGDTIEISTIEGSTLEEAGIPTTARSRTNTMDNVPSGEVDPDPNRAARARWIRINRRFQLVITIVALVFSLLLFAILVCWVVLTSAYVVSIDKSCDVPLKAYFWLVTLQLILDVFRTDIMRLFFRWDANSNQHIPCRVITYNIAYLTYALLVLRLGIHSVYLDKGATCRRTAPELFQSSTAFVSLTIAAWSTIVLGYLVPFCFVATLLTWNGYTPSADTPQNGTPNPFTVFPSSISAPPGCVDQLRVVVLEDFPDDFPMECCICMEDFVGTEVIVMTECNHVFHKQCCREWLRQARTCPVCRMDIPTALENGEDPEHGATSPSRQPRHLSQRGPSSQLGFGATGRPFARNDFHHDVVSLLRILRHREGQLRSRRTDVSDTSNSEEATSGVREPTPLTRNQSLSVITGREDGSGHSSLEEGRIIRPYPPA